MYKVFKILLFLTFLSLIFWSYGQTNGGLILTPSTKMTITGRKVWCSTLVMESGASLLGNSGLVFSNGASAIVKRTITGTGLDSASTTWHDVSSPTSEGTANTFSGGLMNGYDEPSQFWISVTNQSTPMVAGRGYSVAMPATGDVAFTGGVPNSGDLFISGLTSTPGENPGYEGWNLLGNPFPSAINWDIGSWNRSNIDAAVYIWKQDNGNYVCWPAQNGFGTMSGGIIPVGQGFMIHVTSTGTGSITIPENARQHSEHTKLMRCHNTSDGIVICRIVDKCRTSGSGSDAVHIPGV